MLIVNYLSGGILKDVRKFWRPRGSDELKFQSRKNVSWEYQLFSSLQTFTASKHEMWIRWRLSTRGRRISDGCAYWHKNCNREKDKSSVTFFHRTSLLVVLQPLDLFYCLPRSMLLTSMLYYFCIFIHNIWYQLVIIMCQVQKVKCIRTL